MLAQLAIGGKLIAPVIEAGGQDLVVFQESVTDVSRETVFEVLYVNLCGQYGAIGESES